MNGSSKRITQSAYFHNLAMAEMNKRNIPPTPENYAVWFEYVVGDDEAIIRQIKVHDADRVTYTAQVNADLYNRYIKVAQIGEEVDSTKQILETIIDDIVNTMSTSTGSMRTFMGKLRSKMDEVKQIRSARDLKQLIIQLGFDIKGQVDSNVELMNKFNALQAETEDLRSKVATSARELLIDELTRVGNRRGFNQLIGREIQTYYREGTPLAIIMLDIDFFKKFNDKFGHDMGDKVLRYVATVLNKTVKGKDLIYRIGGEEFVVVLPNTQYKGALIVGEQLREEVRKHRLVDKSIDVQLDRVTISLGVACFRRDDTADTITRRADQALYSAKRSGRDQVCGESDIVETA